MGLKLLKLTTSANNRSQYLAMSDYYNALSKAVLESGQLDHYACFMQVLQIK